MQTLVTKIVFEKNLLKKITNKQFLFTGNYTKMVAVYTLLAIIFLLI